MSVLIKGMKMPSGCISCPLKSYGTIDEFKYYCDMTGAFVGRWSGKKINKRHKDCPLVEVKTPHGRLVDFGDIKYKGYTEAEITSMFPTVMEEEEE